MKPTKRIKRRTPKKDWVKEVNNGNISGFYNSTEWKIVREQVMIRDKGICQFFNGKFKPANGAKPYKIKLVDGKYCHHIKELKDRPDLGLDINNLVLLSHIGHEIVHGRYGNEKKIVAEERW